MEIGVARNETHDLRTATDELVATLRAQQPESQSAIVMRSNDRSAAGRGSTRSCRTGRMPTGQRNASRSSRCCSPTAASSTRSASRRSDRFSEYDGAFRQSDRLDRDHAMTFIPGERDDDENVFARLASVLARRRPRRRMRDRSQDARSGPGRETVWRVRRDNGSVPTPDGPMEGTIIPITLADGRTAQLVIPKRQASDARSVYLVDNDGLHPVQLKENATRQDVTQRAGHRPAAVASRPRGKTRSWEKEALIIGGSAGGGAAIGAIAGGKKGAGIGGRRRCRRSDLRRPHTKQEITPELLSLGKRRTSMMKTVAVALALLGACVWRRPEALVPMKSTRRRALPSVNPWRFPDACCPRARMSSSWRIR